jgi:hypothetical protein
MNKIKKSELKKLIKEIIKENKTLLREAAEVTCVFGPNDNLTSFNQACNGTAELPSNCSGNGGYGMGCSGACSIDSVSSVGNDSVWTFSCMGMQVYDPVGSVDFDQSFYDEYEGEYGPFPGQEIRPDKAIPGKTSNLGKAKKMIRETIKSLLLEVENYNSAEEAKQNCWMGNGDCLTDNGQAMECNQVYNTQTNTYSNSCGMAIQGGGTLTPNKNKNIPNIKNKNVYKRTNRRSR